MAIERVGYRRLYDSIGCSLSDREELEFGFGIQGYDVMVYIGHRPRRGIVISSDSGKYVFPDGISPMGKWQYFKNPADSDYPRNFFTEIQCIKSIEVPTELSEKFHNDKKSGAHNEIIKLAEKDISNFRNIAALVAGIIGLRFHPQFVLELINENVFAIRDEEDWAYRITGSWLQMLEELSLKPTGVEAIQNTFKGVEKAQPSAHEFAIAVFRWILRAWSERDGVSKFLALFTPLEIALGKVSKDDITDNQQEKRFNKIKVLISNSNEDEKEELLAYLEHLEKLHQPGLALRFEALANEAKLNGYENDIVAFGKFNKIRNSLLHRGNPNIKLTVSVGEEDTQQLEDLVERYISWILFRDNIVYQTRFRKMHS
ncbi:MAG: hypothetical protein M5U11_00100 [Anaerolineales bacterium]|nr:hypothetical protein [Anaerolineales bacterium]GER79113.1 conserved hypothetical protein [Candidatus Denitrolinea symbiosum]HPO85045.1 hypothetical protein [Candidatus Hydrogenedentota bacterium]